MSLLRLVTFRSLGSRKGRVLLSTFGIILGVAAFLAIRVTNQTAIETVGQLFEDTSGKADLVVTTNETSRRDLTDKILNRAESTEGIEAAVPSVQARTELAENLASNQIDLGFLGINLSGLLLYGIDSSSESLVRDYQVVQGRLLNDELDAGEIVLVESYAVDNELQIGDWVQILTPVGVQDLKLVGLIARDGPGQINNGSFGLVPIETLQTLFERGNELDQIDIVTSISGGNSQGLEAVKSELQNRVGEDFTVIYPASQGERATQMLYGYQIGLNFLSGMALFVGVFLIYNAFSMTVVERTRELGFLRTVGITRWQITLQVLAEAILLGMIGSFIGVAFGLLLARGLAQFLSLLLEQEIAITELTLELLGASLLLGLGVTLVAAFIPAFQAGRISPLAALRIRGTRREGWIIRFGWSLGVLLLLLSGYILVLNPFPYDVQFRLGSLTVSSLFLGATLTIPVAVVIFEWILRPFISLFYGGSGQIGGRNIQRSKIRSTLTVAALMVGVSMILITRGMTNSFRSDLEGWIDAYIGGDLIVSSSSPIRSLVWRKLKTIDGVAAAAPVRYFEVSWNKTDGSNQDLTFMGLDPASYLDVTSIVFSDSQQDQQDALDRFSQGGAIFVSSVLSEMYDLQPGDTILLRTRYGLGEFDVAAVVVDFFNQGQVIQGSWDDMRRLFLVDDANIILVKVEPGNSYSEIQRQIENAYGRRYNLSVASNKQLVDRAMSLLRQSYSLFDVLALIAMFVASLGVINTLTMNVMERIQEIGMLRSIGLTRGQVIKMILAEASLMGMVGGVMGLVLGVVLTRIFLLGMTAMSGYKVTFIMPAASIIAGLFISLVVSQLAALFPARRAARTRILEAIHYE